MTSPRIIPELWHQTTLRGGILAHLTGLRTADHGPLTEGDIVRLNGEGPRLRVTYGPYTDFSSNFAGIGWYLAYIDQYAGDAHSSIDDWAEEAMHVVDQSPPRAPAEVLHGPSGRANPLLIQDGCYQFAPGICEGSRIVVRDCPGRSVLDSTPVAAMAQGTQAGSFGSSKQWQANDARSPARQMSVGWHDPSSTPATSRDNVS